MQSIICNEILQSFSLVKVSKYFLFMSSFYCTEAHFNIQFYTSEQTKFSKKLADLARKLKSLLISDQKKTSPEGIQDKNSLFHHFLHLIFNKTSLTCCGYHILTEILFLCPLPKLRNCFACWLFPFKFRGEGVKNWPNLPTKRKYNR